MNRKPTARRRRAAPAAVAGILVLTACAGSPAAEPAAPDPAASPADTAAPPPEPESQPEPRWIHVDPGAGFLDLFDSLSAAEQSCIRDALDEDEFGAVMEERVRDVYDTDPGGLGPTFDCLTPDAVRSLEIAFLDAALQEALGLGELSRDQVSCLRDRLATGDGLFLRPGLDEVTLFLDSFEVLAHCVPDALLIGMLPAMGAPELEELSGEQRSCLHDWLRWSGPTSRAWPAACPMWSLPRCSGPWTSRWRT